MIVFSALLPFGTMIQPITRTKTFDYITSDGPICKEEYNV